MLVNWQVKKRDMLTVRQKEICSSKVYVIDDFLSFHGIHSSVMPIEVLKDGHTGAIQDFTKASS
jgi:hypothetical protein